VRQVDELEVVKIPLRGDAECRRWYTDGGEACIVLTQRGELVEPFPTFGPSAYRLLAHEVSLDEARAYALEHGFPHPRNAWTRPGG
jgi:hypothetical protein